MRRLFACLIVVIALAAAPARAARSLEAARQSASSARAQVNEIRSRQMSMRMELNRLAARIQELKARQKGTLLTGGELEASLRRSQELSGSLTEVAQQLATAEAALERENLALLELLNAELEHLRQSWDTQTDRAARSQTVQRMRALRQEREQIRAMLPAAKVPALTASGGDDPEDLLEQADALRDSEDKVRQKMKALEARIAELREEQELDRRMSDFLGDEAMFDEQDRRLRRSHEVSGVRQGMPPLFGAPESADGLGASADQPSHGLHGGGPMPPGLPGRPVPLTYIAKGADARPVVGGVDTLLLDDAGGQDLDALEAQLRKLKALANQLGKRAEAMEERARELK